MILFTIHHVNVSLDSRSLLRLSVVALRQALVCGATTVLYLTCQLRSKSYIPAFATQPSLQHKIWALSDPNSARYSDFGSRLNQSEQDGSTGLVRWGELFLLRFQRCTVGVLTTLRSLRLSQPVLLSLHSIRGQISTQHVYIWRKAICA